MTDQEEQFPFEDSPPVPTTAGDEGRPRDKAPSLAASPSTSPASVLVEAEKSRAIQEVQAALVIAQRFPRDEIKSETRMIASASRYGFAEKAFYTYKRGAQNITGPTIRVAEDMARSWGNLRYGFRELERLPGKSVVHCYAWDLQTNTMAERTITVEHKIQLQGGKVKHLTDPRDQYEQVANQAQRRVRAAILELIPHDIVENVVKRCRDTIARGPADVPLAERVKRMVLAFKTELSVTQEMIESFLGHKLEALTREELTDLVGVYNSIKEGAPREDFFDLGGTKKTEGGNASELNRVLEKKEKGNG